MFSEKITVVVPTYNKVYRLRFLLESLVHQTVSCLIVIVDDGSEDGTKELIQEYKAKLRIKYIYQENKGRSQARNKGLENCDTKYILFCDDDMILPKFYIEKHIAILEHNPNTIVHGQIWNLPLLSYFEDPLKGKLYDYVSEDEKKHSKILHKYLLSLDDIKDQEKIEKQKKIIGLEQKLLQIKENNILKLQFLYCSGQNISCETALIKRENGFDSRFDVDWGCEDVELGYRLQKAGVKFLYCEEAYNYHISHYRRDYKEKLIRLFDMFYTKHNDLIIKKLPELLLSKAISVEEFLEKMYEN